MNPLDFLPDEWRTDVVVLRGGGRDPKTSNPLPVIEIPVTGCFVWGRSTSDPVDRSDLATTTAVLYREPGFEFRPSDRIRVPASAAMPGMWQVDGRPTLWPFCWEVPLKGA